MIAATAIDLSETVALSSIGCALRLSEVYERIVFSEPFELEEGSLDA